MMERSSRKTLQGRVASARGDKTIIVEVESYKAHSLYSKRFKVIKRFAVHDEKNLAKVNDLVTIMETRPLSKTKHFRLVEIKQHAVEGEK
ncbi:30S ribosomal protein S17 [Mycoplasmopsis caviae]|uniref:Small ribosomal subunit protein uS17 n=2 Tax=Mycoplasmopsis caviae TaxID=55603 RepID=A0ABY5J0Z7_9BACT|nr:30S ribosomal protein S17 [Mycoplasmopsis caviae]UUD35771.1 30S ribosomal protein S17 [Mycoplasmopsis caviae]